MLIRLLHAAGEGRCDSASTDRPAIHASAGVARRQRSSATIDVYRHKRSWYTVVIFNMSLSCKRSFICKLCASGHRYRQKHLSRMHPVERSPFNYDGLMLRFAKTAASVLATTYKLLPLMLKAIANSDNDNCHLTWFSLCAGCSLIRKQQKVLFCWDVLRLFMGMSS